MRIFNNNTLLTISETSGKIILNDAQINNLKNAIYSIRESGNHNDVIVVYRGESSSYMKSLYNSDGWEYSENKLLDCLFYFGSKSKGFYDSNEKYISDLNSVSSKQAEMILKQLQKIVRTSRFQKNISPNLKASIFDIDVQRFVKLLNENELFVDYYCSFLHKAFRLGYNKNNETRIVSSSMSLLVASKFSNSKGKNEDAYVIVYVMPREYANNAIINIESMEEDVVKSGLPSLKDSELYPEQKEICIKRALFPHHILCVYKRKQKEIIFNPHLFANQSFDIKQMILNGINIDQSEFRNRIAQTRYSFGVAKSELGFEKVG